MHVTDLHSVHNYFDQDMIEPDVVSAASGTACVLSARCPDKAGPNEDAAAVIPLGGDAAVLAVADGLGGSAVGEQASRLALESLQDAIEELHGTDALIRTGIINGFDRANAAVQELGVGAATTLAAVEISDGAMRPFHVGDSAILLFGGRGKLKFQSISHSPVGYGLEAGFLDEKEALRHEERHVVSNVIGTPDMRIEVGSRIRLRPRDCLLLATDGILDNFETGELCDLVTKGPLPSSVGDVAEAVRFRMTNGGALSKPDDYSIICFRPT